MRQSRVTCAGRRPNATGVSYSSLGVAAGDPSVRGGDRRLEPRHDGMGRAEPGAGEEPGEDVFADLGEEFDFGTEEAVEGAGEELDA